MIEVAEFFYAAISDKCVYPKTQLSRSLLVHSFHIYLVLNYKMNSAEV